MSKQTLGWSEVAQEGLTDWRPLFAGLHARFRTGDFTTGLRLLNAIAAEAEAADHHPDLDLHYAFLHVTLTSHDAGGVTQRDVRLARRISALAAEQGVAADPASVSVLEIALDTPDPGAVRPFWAAALGLRPDADSGELVDPDGRLPTVWFQRSETSTGEEAVGGRQRFHLDLRVPPEVAPGRVAEAVAAGGTLVSDAHAPAFWVLADPEGNHVCICTGEGRA